MMVARGNSHLTVNYVSMNTVRWTEKLTAGGL